MDHLQPLDPLNLSGNISVNWQRWKQRWNLYLKASGASEKTEDIKCALFLHMIGEDSLRIYDTFTISEAEKDKIDPLITKFDGHFTPKKNLTYERYIFNTCFQNGRPFDIFLIDIKNKAKSCEFDAVHDGLIRDRIVCGIDCNQTREKLLRTTDLTLEKAISFVRACETSKTQVIDLQNTASADALYKSNENRRKQNYHKSENSNSSDRHSYNYHKSENSNSSDRRSYSSSCHFCGSNHRRGACPAYGKRCSKCNRTNHFASVCQSKPRIDSLENELPQDIQISELFIEAIEIEVSSLETNCITEMIIPATINDTCLDVKIDTGAQCNVIPEDIFTRIQKRPKLIPVRTTLRSYGGNSVPVIGKCNMNVTMNSKSINCDFFVVALRVIPYQITQNLIIFLPHYLRFS